MSEIDRKIANECVHCLILMALGEINNQTKCKPVSTGENHPSCTVDTNHPDIQAARQYQKNLRYIRSY